MKKISIGFAILGIIVLSGYIYLRHHLGTPGEKPSPTAQAQQQHQPATKSAESPLDLRPLLIAKLKQLVKDGSGGLYNLFIQQADPDIVNQTITIKELALIPDTAALQAMERERKAPDDVFKISVHSLTIDGLGIADFLHKDSIRLTDIHIISPQIEIFHKQRSYNAADKQNLYQRLVKQFKLIAIAKIVVENGSITVHNASNKRPLRLNNVEVLMDHLLIDSTTQNDKQRFLFAKGANLSFKHFNLFTPDNLYEFNVGRVNITAPDGKVVASDITLLPKGSDAAFQKSLRYNKICFHLTVPQLRMKSVYWWSFFTSDELKADELYLDHPTCIAYLDRTLPNAPDSNIPNFPQQLLMQLKLPVHLNAVKITDATITYKEYSPATKATGIINLDHANITATNATNMSVEMKKNRFTNLSATAAFMHKVPFSINYKFDLARVRSGAFTGHISLGAIDNALANQLAKPMGMLLIKRGQLQRATVDIHGDNTGASGTVLMLYTDLHITPLKMNSDSTGMKKKSLTSFVANTFLIKNNNPSGSGQSPRVEQAQHKRVPGGDLFNLTWKTILVGILKTIGVTAKLAD